MALLDVKLLKLDLPIVKNGAEHEHVRGAIVPAQTVEFGPDRSRAAHRIARVAPECEIARAKRTAEAIGEAERFGGLSERDTGRSSGDIPN